jgi:hypothetical protein
MTSTGVQYVLEGDGQGKVLPCFSFIPIVTFKSSGFHFTEEAYQANSFELEDIFTTQSVNDLRNKSAYDIFETKTVHHGKVFSICCKLQVSTFEGILLSVKQYEWELYIFFHQREDAIWFTFRELPNYIMFSLINTKRSSGFIAAKIFISEIRSREIIYKTS